MKQKRRAYSADDIAQIIEMRKAHIPEKEIAKALGRPYNSVHSKLKQLRDNGLVPVVRDISPVTAEDINDFVMSKKVGVGVVEGIMTRLGTLYRGKLPQLEAVIDAYVAQQGRCFYFGTTMDISYNSDSLSRAELVYTEEGKPIWITRMAKRMRGRLAHGTFLRAVAIIYNHQFTNAS